MYSRFIYLYYILSNWDMVYGMDGPYPGSSGTDRHHLRRAGCGWDSQATPGPGPGPQDGTLVTLW